MQRILLAVASLLVVGCSFLDSSSSGDSASVVSKWAEAYFNFDYVKAAKYITPESEVWLQFAASNISEADIEVIRQQNSAATIEILSYDAAEPDTLNAAHICVRNFVSLDSIGRAGHHIDEATFVIPMVKREGKWLVRMEGLPRSEKQNPD